MHYQQSFLQVRRTCGQCSGRGQIIRRPCIECKGEAWIRQERKLKVNIPAGVDTGTRVRVTGEGQPGANGGAHGDLYVFLRVKEHPIFDRNERRTALHGAGEHRAGSARNRSGYPDLRWPADRQDSRRHQHGEKIRLKGLGVPRLQVGRARRPVGSRRREGPEEADPRTAQAVRAASRNAARGKRAAREEPVRKGQRLLHVGGGYCWRSNSVRRNPVGPLDMRPMLPLLEYVISWLWPYIVPEVLCQPCRKLTGSITAILTSSLMPNERLWRFRRPHYGPQCRR